MSRIFSVPSLGFERKGYQVEKLKQYGGTTTDENEIGKFGLSCVTSLFEDDPWEK